MEKPNHETRAIPSKAKTNSPLPSPSIDPMDPEVLTALNPRPIVKTPRDHEATRFHVNFLKYHEHAEYIPKIDPPTISRSAVSLRPLLDGDCDDHLSPKVFHHTRVSGLFTMPWKRAIDDRNRMIGTRNRIDLLPSMKPPLKGDPK
jgi:hypothetical protein